MEKSDLELLFSIIKAGMKGESLSLSTLNENSDLFRVIKEQTFHPFLYPISKDNRFKKYYLASYLLVEQFNKNGELLKSIFDDNEIDHVFLKGYELRKLYVDPVLRLSGDLDILVREKDYKKAKKILLENGASFIDECEHHAEFKLNNVIVELHRLLIPSSEKYASYFSSPFDNVIVDNNFTYKFDSAYNLSYILAHYIKHLYSGAGLRELCDVYIILEKEEIDFDKFNKFLKEFKLVKFFSTVLSELKILFDFDKIEFEFNKSSYDLISYSLMSGIHGHGKNNERMENWQRNVKENKFVFLLKKLFLPVKAMFRIYPWTKSIILLPFGYVVRFFYLITKRFDWFKKVAKAKNNKDEDLFKEIGLKE